MGQDAMGKCLIKYMEKRLRTQALQGSTFFVALNKSSRLGHLYYSFCLLTNPSFGGLKDSWKGSDGFFRLEEETGVQSMPAAAAPLIPLFCLFLSRAMTSFKLVSHWMGEAQPSGQLAVSRGRDRVGVRPSKALCLLSQLTKPKAQVTGVKYDVSPVAPAGSEAP